MRKLIFVLLLIPAIIIADENPEPKYWWGLNVSGSYVMHNADFTRLYNLNTCCPEPGLQGGSGLSYSGGLSLYFKINPNIYFETRLAYHNLSADFDPVNETIGKQVRDQNGTTVISDVDVQHLFSPELNLFSLEPGFQYFPVNNLFLNAGARLGYFLDGRFDFREELMSPANVTYLNGTLVDNVNTNINLEQLNKIQLGLYLGAGYQIDIDYRTKIVPEIRYYQSLSSVTPQDWSVSNLTFGLTYQRGVVPPKKKATLRDTVFVRDTTIITSYDIKKEEIKLIDSDKDYDKQVGPKTIEYNYTIKESYQRTVPKEVRIDLALDAFGIDEKGNKEKDPTIVIEEIESEEGFPLLPFIYFRDGSDDIQEAGMKVFSKTAYQTFDVNELQMDVFHVYENTLNVLGKRLSETDDRITIIGYRSRLGSDRTDLDLISDRIENVKEYLVDVCGIDEKRISDKVINKTVRKDVKDTDDIYEEAQAVEIAFNNSELLTPVYIKDIVRNATPPEVQIHSKISTDEGLDSWNIDLTQDDQLLRTYSGKDSVNVSNWNIAKEPLPKLEEPVEIRLTAKDNYGNERDISKDLTIKQLTIKKKREEFIDDKRVEKYSLIVFDYNDSQLKSEHQSVVDYVKEKIKPNSVVTISGYADRTGEADYNMSLSERRCNEVLRALKGIETAEIKTMPYGNTVLLYDNDTALGRALSRTVQIQIETPIEN